MNRNKKSEAVSLSDSKHLKYENVSRSKEFTKLDWFSELLIPAVTYMPQTLTVLENSPD